MFYPEDEVFKVLTKAMRQSARTYELFSLARLFLEKPERLIMVIRPRKDSGASFLHMSVPDGLPFEHEDEAVNHVLDRHLDTFFTTEAVEVEPPKGNFPCVMKCGMTGELLGPPNYHRYPIIIQEHYARKLANRTSFEGFQRRLETLRDPESVQQWLDGMKHVTRYTPKVSGGGEAKAFESLESAKFHLVTYSKAALVKTVPFVRMHGRDLEKLPSDNQVRRSIEALLDQQRRFPLDTANHLRGRLRKLQFAVYKRGSKGVSYVCAVRRRFRTPDQTFAPSIQRLIAFIEEHPGVSAGALPHDLLGLDPDAVIAHQEEAARAASPKEGHQPKPQPGAEEESPDAGQPVGAAGAEAAADAPAEAAAEPAETAGEPIATETAAEGQEESAPGAVEQIPATAAAPETAAETESQPQLSGEDRLRLAELRRDLRWLVSEGYVVELEDATLYAPPPRSPAEAAQESADEDGSGDSPTDDEAQSGVEAEAGADPEAEASGGQAAPAEPEVPLEPEAQGAPPEVEPEAPKVPAESDMPEVREASDDVKA